MVHVAAQFWNELLVIFPGVGTDVTDVGRYRARSMSHGTPDFAFAPDGSKPDGTAHLLTGPFVNLHIAFELRHLGLPPKRPGLAGCRMPPKRFRSRPAPMQARHSARASPRRN
jgi:hypothetical protein